MKNNRSIAGLMAAVMLFGFAGCGKKTTADKKEKEIIKASVEETTSEETTTEEAAPADVFGDRKFEIGNTVVFGLYTPKNPKNTDPIEWVVLSVEGNRALLVSKYVIESQPYNTKEYAEDGGEVTWENCTLRTWLNDEFFNQAFTDAEKSVIKTVTLKNPDNSYYGTKGGSDTEDKVFILSAEEIDKYYGFRYFDEENACGYNQDLMISPVENLKGGNKCLMWEMYKDNYEKTYKDFGYSEDVIGRKGATWWVRTPGIAGHADSMMMCTACRVGNMGDFGEKYWTGVTETRVGVRPAVYVEF